MSGGAPTCNVANASSILVESSGREVVASPILPAGMPFYSKKVLRAVRPKFSRDEVTELEGATLFDPVELDRAIVGIARDENDCAVAAYDYDLLVNEYANMAKLEGADDEEAHQGAVEHVDFNTIGILPNIRSRRPIIVREEGDDPDESGERYVFAGISYHRLA